jgi:hypothetical protein
MIRRLLLWRLRYQRDKLSDRVDWIRDCVWSAQVALDRAEADLREAQARLWIAEAPRKLLDPSRSDTGVSTRG